ncbi:MAG: sugar transferase [Caldilineales bacterium]|nr:sugar transferase [Caldilineales bacterium]
MAEKFLRVHKGLLVAFDGVLVIAAFYLAWYVRYELEWYRSVDPASYTEFDFYLWIAVLAAFLIILAFYMEGLYRLRRGTGYLDEFYRLFNGVTTVTIVLMVGNFMFQPAYHSRLVYGIAGILILVFTATGRALNRQFVAWLRSRGAGIRRVVLVGAGEVSRRIMRVLLANRALGYEVVGFLDDNPERGSRDIGPFPALGPIDNLPEIISERRVDEVIITLPWQYHRRIMSVLDQCERLGVRTRVVPDVLQMSLDRVHVEVIEGIPMLGMRQGSFTGPRSAVKRTMDILLTGFGLVLMAPLMIIIAILIKLDSSGPALFVQERIGRNGKPFHAYKFRTMVVEAEAMREQLTAFNEADGPLFKMRNDPRTTRVGRHLRRFSLDELPQTINVLRGEMSLVGPRPGLPAEVAAYEPWHRKRLEAMPGLTGLWQVSGRSDLGFDEMMLLDIYYVENWSPVLDMSILLRTLPKVLFGNGAY